MAEISVVRPIGFNRAQQRIIYDDGRRVRRCRGPHNPVYYFDRKEGMRPIDIKSLDHSAKSKTGDFTKRFANIRSVGIRNDLKTSKFLGIRKDDDQDGNEQLEISLLSLKINGLEGSFIPGSMNIKSANIQDFGGFQIGSTRQGTRFYVPYSNNIDSFELKLFIHATGLTPRRHDIVNEFWFENSKGELFARFRQPDIFDSTGEHTVWDGQPKRVIDHALEPAEGGWIYTKYSTMPLSGLGLPVGSLIDGDIYYSTAADGYVEYAPMNTAWSTARGASTGTYIYGVGENDIPVSAYKLIVAENYFFYFKRCFFIVDTSGSNDPLSAVWSLKNYFTPNYYVSVGKSTHSDVLVVQDFDTRHTVEWSHQISSNLVRFGGSVDVADINLAGNTKFSTIEYEKDYSNVEPTDTTQRTVRICASDYPGTVDDPYLDITEAAGWDGTFNGVSTPGSVNGISSENIGSVNGI